METMTRSKSRDPSAFAALQADLEAVAVPVPETKRGRGRPQVDTEPLQLRIPTDLRDRLLAKVGEESVKERRVVTIQQLILRAVEEKYGG
jgi:hypothetical protein